MMFIYLYLQFIKKKYNTIDKEVLRCLWILAFLFSNVIVISIKPQWYGKILKLLQNKLNCVIRESNPSQLVGNQLC